MKKVPMGELIGRLAKQKGISIRKLASNVGMNYQTLYATVRRKGDSVNPKYIPLLAKELEVSEGYLTGIENPYDDLTYYERELLNSIGHILSGVDQFDRGDLSLHIAFFLEQQRDLILQTFIQTKQSQYDETIYSD